MVLIPMTRRVDVSHDVHINLIHVPYIIDFRGELTVNFNMIVIQDRALLKR